jgi:hypothetical protein
VSERIYTVEDANAMLPSLRERLVRIREARTVMFASAELVKERLERESGGAAGDPRYWEAQSTLRTEIEWFATEDILLRDPQSGLVDFPSEREGRRVWLCWKLDEDEVGHWHEVDSGYIGRRPL